jgi:hypothetical protein
MASITLDRATLAALLIGVFETTHPFADQWGQTSWQACCKGLKGTHRVDRDGKDDEHGPYTASQLGRRAACAHVAAYTTIQTAATVAVTVALGRRIRPRALLAAAAVNGLTHLVIDRRRPLLWAADKTGNLGYVQHATVMRRLDKNGKPVIDEAGPGTALMELDQAAHRLLGLVAAVVASIAASRD